MPKAESKMDSKQDVMKRTPPRRSSRIAAGECEESHRNTIRDQKESDTIEKATVPRVKPAVAIAAEITVGIVHEESRELDSFCETEEALEEKKDQKDDYILLKSEDLNVNWNKSSESNLVVATQKMSTSDGNINNQNDKSNTVVLEGSIVMTDSSTRSREVISIYVQAFADYLPANSGWREYLLYFEPAICHAAQLLHVLFAIVAIKVEVGVFIAQHMWAILQPYKPEELFPALVGLILCFFGGSFMGLIGAVEAYRMCGMDITLKSIADLREDFEKIKVANDKDDAALDVDNTGEADVLTVHSGQDLLTRKTSLFLKTVNPQRFVEAVVGINMGFVAVVATLKVKFAKAITLGNSLGDMAEKPANHFLLPFVEASLPSEYRGWAAVGLRYAVKCVCVSLAWYLQRAMSSYHSAISGGIMFGRHILGYLSGINMISKEHKDNHNLAAFLGYVAAFCGIYFQISYGFRLPFPLNVLLFPFTILEYALVWIVHHSTSFMT